MNYCSRTDLALEARPKQRGIPGVSEQTRSHEGISVSDIRIETAEAEKMLGKPVGRYVTIEAPAIHDRDPKTFQLAAMEVQAALCQLMDGLKDEDEVMVIGLGNRMVTPDSLGPKTVEKLFVTRHIHAKAAELAPKGMRPVCAIAPGVFGVTGLETAEVVRALVDRIKPVRVILIDALVSLRLKRINTAIQLNDVGLLPGAGVGNRQSGLNAETLGVPVTAIGVPTVVRAGTIVMETLAHFWPEEEESERRGSMENAVWDITDQLYGDMVVTPKDVDLMTDDAASILSEGINRMLHRPYFSEIELLLS